MMQEPQKLPRFRRPELTRWRMKTGGSGGPLVNRQARNAETAPTGKIANSLDQLRIAGMARNETASMLAVSSKSVTISSPTAPSYIPAIHDGSGGLANTIGGNRINAT